MASAGGPGAIGCKFVEHWKDNNPGKEIEIPKVDIKYKIYRVSDFDQKKGVGLISMKPNTAAIDHVY